MKFSSTPFTQIICIVFFILISCQSKKEDGNKDIDEVVVTPLEEVKNDSITINILVPADRATGINMVDKYSKHLYLSFKNDSKEDSIISKTILRPHKLTKFDYGIRLYGSQFDRPAMRFLVSDTVDQVNLVYEKESESLRFRESASELDISAMEDSYDSVRVLVHKWKEDDSKFYPLLDSIHNSFSLQYNVSNYMNSGDYNSAEEIPFEGHRKFNDLFYYRSLQQINPDDPRVEELIKNEEIYIPRGPSSGMIYLYLKDRLETIPFDSLNTNQFTDAYRKNLSYGLVNILSSKDFKKANRYLEAKEWLRTTDYYKSAPDVIENMITPLSKVKFKKLLENVKFIDVDSTTFSIYQIIKKSGKKYFMINLWATWCAPCLSNMKKLDEMTLPESLEIINVSSDKTKDIDKWKLMHAEIMEGKISYRFDVDSEPVKDFFEFIKLESIPRHIIFDKNLKLIDHSFYAPYEPQFMAKIFDLDRNEYW